MTWTATITNVEIDPKDDQSVVVTVGFTHSSGAKGYTESHRMPLSRVETERDLDVMKGSVRKTLKALNAKEDKMGKLKGMVGKEISLDPAVSLGLSVGHTIPKHAQPPLSPGQGVS